MDNARYIGDARVTIMEKERIQSFEEFWPYYVGEHSKKATRIFHFAGTTFAVGAVAAGVLLRKKWLFALAPLAGYGPAWFSHFFIEKNKPATFDYPAWSLMADFVMWSKMLRGTMDEEVERVMAARAASESGAPHQAVGAN
ncbi:MAG TPA: DUF962 domain-containing protein [Polyangiaceae bacterium]|nr:DUF962 domain-containing protein [Polyangiaceae bacterium]